MHLQNDQYVSLFVALYVDLFSADTTLTADCSIDYLLISHFILNLQELVIRPTDDANNSRSPLTESTQSQMSSIRFDVVGNFGESLRDGSREDNEDEESEDIVSEHTTGLNASQNDGTSIMQLDSAGSLRPDVGVRKTVQGQAANPLP